MNKRVSRGLGVDLVEISRFASFVKNAKHPFLMKVFSQKEIAYCLGHRDPAPHFAGIFAAKEAASKALGTDEYPFAELEVRHSEDGAPEIWHKSKKISVRVSVSQTSKIAAAVAIA